MINKKMAMRFGSALIFESVLLMTSLLLMLICLAGNVHAAENIPCNLLDIEHAVLLNSYIRPGESGEWILSHSSGSVKTLVMPVKGGVTYTFTRKNETSRLSMGCGSELWRDNGDHVLLNGLYSEDHSRGSITVPPEGKYLYIYFYRENSDRSFQDTIVEAMVTEGEGSAGYTPYSLNSIRDEFYTRDRIFGISFNLQDSLPECSRIENSQGLESEAFDNIYPWAGMKRCNVRLENGEKIITYEGEEGFAVDGSNGNVMVEIPVFYVRRERTQDTERWMLSGTAQDGFEVHPWFRNADGTTDDFRYYGAYKASSDGSGIFSASGKVPYSNTGCDSRYFPELLDQSGFQRNNIEAYSALQYLFLIEYATRDSQSVFNGGTYSPYFLGGDAAGYRKILGIRDNELVLLKGVGISGNSFGYFSRGMQIYIGLTPSEGTVRTITGVREDARYLYFKVDGDPIDFSKDLVCGGTAQITGSTDSLEPHSGCARGQDHHVASFRYRYIEDPWGGIWEMLDGIKLRNGKYYVTSRDHYQEEDLQLWQPLSYAAPMVQANDHDGFNWIKTMGFDPDRPVVALPSELFEDEGRRLSMITDAGTLVGLNILLRGDAYYADAFYSSSDTENTFVPVIGGAWDHHENAGLFCMRFLPENIALNWLYGERITL